MVLVCVIGAGGAGIAAAKHSLDEGYQVVVYEQSEQAGGLWIFTDQTHGHSPMYKHLRTNVPHQIMAFSDYDYPNNLPSFVGYDIIRQYLNDYVKFHKLAITYNTTVHSVEPLNGKWKVTACNGNNCHTRIFDIVFVCNGHHFAPYFPFEISNFTGKAIHSHDYRDAKDYRNERVAVIGTGPSGIDIALQLTDYAKIVYLIGKQAVLNNAPVNMVQFPVNLQGLNGRTAFLANGEKIENIDTVIIATGYTMKFPFFKPEVVEVNGNGFVVSPIWQHVVHARYPKSLFFIGLTLMTATMPLFEVQVKLALAFVSGRAILPDEQTLLNFEKERLTELAQKQQGPKFYHFLMEEQWDYMKELARIGRFSDNPFHKVDKRMASQRYSFQK